MAAAELSEYELERLRNIARNQEALRSLGLLAPPTKVSVAKRPPRPSRAIGLSYDAAREIIENFASSALGNHTQLPAEDDDGN